MFLEELPNGLKLIELNQDQAWKTLPKIILLIKTCMAFRKVLKKEKPEIVISFLAFPILAAAALKRFGADPFFLVWPAQNTKPRKKNALPGFLKYRVMRSMTKQIDYFIAVSRGIANRLIK